METVKMGQNQGYGAFLVASGVLAFFLIAQLRSRTRKDPQWLLPAGVRRYIGSAAELINAVLLVLGAAIGTACIALGLFFLRWV